LSTECVSMELHNKLDKLVKLSWAGRQKITYNLLEQNFDTTTTKVLLSLHKLIGDHHTTVLYKTHDGKARVRSKKRFNY
jgi:hypothetical protein